MPFSAVTADLGYVLRFILSPPALLCILAAGGATFCVHILLHFVLARPLGAAAEMAAAGGPFRAVSSPSMLYPPLLAPAVQAAYDVLARRLPAMEAVDAGCTYCEVQQCDTTVGYGHHPDTAGRVTKRRSAARPKCSSSAAAVK